MILLNTRLKKYFNTILSIIALLLITQHAIAIESDDAIVFSDKPLTERLTHPDWFTVSFLDLPEDLTEANKNNRGLIIYYGQGFCPYCKAFLKNNWEKKDIVKYTRKNFDVVAIDVLGTQQITGMDNKKYTEKEYAVKQGTNFTPSLVFYDNKGKYVLRFRGYRPPYQFRAALEFVADGHYKKEDFKTYLARAEKAFSYGKDELNKHQSFQQAPYNLTAKLNNKQQHTLVVLERKKCHACDVLHAGPLQSDMTKTLLQKFKVIQLDIQSETPITIEKGIKLSAKAWSDKLDIDYAPTLLFYDKSGKEVMRVDSLVGIFRLQGVLNYIATKAYKQYPTFISWRESLMKK